MRRLIAPVLLCVAALALSILPASAQSTDILVVSSCGNQTFKAGATIAPLTVDTTGKLCGVTAGGQTGGYDTAVAVTPTVQNAAYASGNAIGGLQTVSFFRSTTQPSGILNNISVASQGGSTTGLTLYIFNSNPTASTCTDKAAFVLGAADVAKLIKSGPVVLTPALVGAGTTATFAAQQSPTSVKNADGVATTNLYVCAVVNGAVTPASTTDLVFGYAGSQD